jgi:hypothetical protein
VVIGYLEVRTYITEMPLRASGCRRIGPTIQQACIERPSLILDDKSIVPEHGFAKYVDCTQDRSTSEEGAIVGCL